MPKKFVVVVVVVAETMNWFVELVVERREC